MDTEHTNDNEKEPSKKRTFLTEKYIVQKPKWPKQGRHILAQYDDDSILVYQAYALSFPIFFSTPVGTTKISENTP